jgi:hypothetical protein
MRANRTFTQYLPTRTRETATPSTRNLFGHWARLITLFGACALLGGCGAQTVFKSDFGHLASPPTPLGSQPVGNLMVDPLSDQYSIADPNGGMVITRSGFPPGASPTVDRAAVQCNFGRDPYSSSTAPFHGDGTYVFTTFLYMPRGAGAATIQFEPFGQPVKDYGKGFLHVDLLPDNMMRLDDNDGTKFGGFPRDQWFFLQVTLKITATPSAHFSLSGAGASGEKDYNVLPPFVPLARQFGAVRFWIGTPWNGYYKANTIVVTRSS